VPYLPWARDGMLAGTLRSALFLGKGSLFLGRMTNLADGASLLMEAQER
jgi:betaine reductase